MAARAQLFVDNEARALARENDDKLQNVTNAIRELNDKFRPLNGQNQQFRKQLLELARDNQQLRQQLREIKGALDEIQAKTEGPDPADARTQKQLSALSKKVGEALDKVALIEQRFPPPPESDLYAEAFGLLQQQQHERAIDGFARLISVYPDGQFHVNAKYWICKALLSLSEYDNARKAAEELLRQYPGNDKEPDALLVIFEALRGMEMHEEAAETLERLLAQHPTSLAADQARQLSASQ